MANIIVYEGQDPLDNNEVVKVIACVDTDPMIALGAYLTTIGRSDLEHVLKPVRRAKSANSFRGIVSSSVCPASELPGKS